MPAMNIYAREDDLPLIDELREKTGKSISSLFSEFLHRKSDEINRDLSAWTPIPSTTTNPFSHLILYKDWVAQ